MNPDDIVEKVWNILPENAREQWSALPTDVDSHVVHDWVREVLKSGLIRIYRNFSEQLKEKLEVIEIAGIIDIQETILVTLGMIEVYSSELK